MKTGSDRSLEGLPVGTNQLKHQDVTERIIGAYYHVYNALGFGFLEKVYQNAMVLELTKRGLAVVPYAPIKVYYEGQPVGDYVADLFVNGCVIVELKAAESLCEEHHAQLLNYLKASDIDVGLLMNFGPRAEVKRKMFDLARPWRPRV